MKILVILIGNILLTGFFAEGQTVLSVTGHLRDKNNDPVPFANVALYDSSALVTGVASDINGDFELTNIPQGIYAIEIQFVGYKAWRREAVFINQNINFGSITMEESSQVLNEVVIRGEVMQKPFEVSAEGLTINPSQNLANIGGSALDVLRNQ